MPTPDPSMEYSMDVAISSEAQPLDASKPIAMSFGFAQGLPGSIWSGEGQKAEKVKQFANVYFFIFDVASKPGSLIEVEIVFASETKVGPTSPFDWTTLTIPGGGLMPLAVSDVSSVGCNLKGVTGWQLGPYNALNAGTFECTITANVIASDQTLKTFDVDPEVQVEGAGPT